MKPGTYTQNYVHLVFAVKYREAALTQDIRERVFSYISGVVTSLKHKSIIVNGVSDHVHILMGLNPNVSISATVRDIKRASSTFINEEGLCKHQFYWQEGYGSFTYSRSQLPRIYLYIENQERHHAKKKFRDEYVAFLKRNGIDYDDRYLFHFWEEQ
ncbi:MAG: IS200/IS605 family transposase [Bacteroidales bacterium]